jgi:hypothetical protein
MIRRAIPVLLLSAGALGLGLVACSSEGGTVVTSNAAEMPAPEGEGASSEAAPEAPHDPAGDHTGHDHAQPSRPIAQADPPPPVDVIGVQYELGMAWAGKIMHKDRMRWEAPDPMKDYFIVVIRELTPHYESRGLEAGKAYHFRGNNDYDFIRDVDLSKTDGEIAAGFGAFEDKPIDVMLKAAEADDLGALKRALAAGVPADARNRSERPVIMVAAKKGSLEVVRALLEAGATADMTDVAGENALHQAARGGHTEIVKLLLESGADVSGTDHLGHTALFFAAEGNAPAVASLLIEKGADPTIKDNRGYTPLAYAKVFLRSRMKPELREVLAP